mgnify:CR=1 FL=1
MDKLSITNFRKVKDTWDLDLAPVTFFTGTNNSGKSSVLKALLLLEDYVKSDNHFELTFNGDNCNKHKIDCYSNAINWTNSKGGNKNLDIKFEYKNKSNDVKLIFTPSTIEDGIFSKGKLKLFEMIRSDKSSLKIKHQGGENYLLTVDNDLLQKKVVSDGREAIRNKAMRLTIKNLTEENRKLFSWAIKEKEIIDNEMFDVNEELDLINPNRNFEGFDNTDFEKYLIDIEITKNTSVLNRWNKKVKSQQLNSLSRAHELYLKMIFFKNEKRKFDKRIIELNQELGDLKKDLTRVNKLLHSDSSQISDLQFMPEFSLSDYDNSERSFDVIIRREMSMYFRQNEKKLGSEKYGKNISSLMVLGDSVINSLQFKIEHLSPQRNSQTRLYYNNDNAHDINKLIDVHSHNPIVLKSSADDFIKYWMNEFDIGEDYKITPIQGLASIVEIKEPKNKSWINLVDKGFGAGQIFAIILQIGICIHTNTYWENKLTSKKAKNYNDLIIIEEPEANLHPAFQSKLAKLFIDTYEKFQIRFILETHSEYVLRTSQVIVKNQFSEIDNNNNNNNNNNIIENKFGPNKTLRLNKVLRDLNISLDYAVQILANAGHVIIARPTTKISKEIYDILLNEKNSTYVSNTQNKLIPFKVYYFNKTEGPYQMRYREDGKFIDEFGSGFFDVSSNLAFDIL